MLGRRRVLVAEDEVIIASELAAAIEEAGGEVVGPVASVRDGLAILSREAVHAAILDVRLVDGLVSPIADVLLERGAAVVFHSASPVPREITERYSDVVVCPKPMPSEHVVYRLAVLMRP
jgi:DNA-binding NtrC family response regulator